MDKTEKDCGEALEGLYRRHPSPEDRQAIDSLVAAAEQGRKLGVAYYPDYVPVNETHFRDMLNQFRKAETKEERDMLVSLWILSLDVNRQDIVVALGRVEREQKAVQP